MSYNASTIVRQVTVAVAPYGISPFAALAELLHARVFPTIAESTNIQLMFLMVYFACLTVVFLCSIALHIFRSKDFWLIRLQRTRRGLYVVPNFQICWQVGTVILLGLFQPYSLTTLRHNHGEEMTGYLAWRTLIWLACLFSAWMAMWGLCVIDGLPNASDDTRIVSHPLFLNTAFPLSFIIVAALVGWSSAIMSMQFDVMMSSFAEVDSSLVGNSLKYGNSTSLAADEALRATIVPIQRAFDEFKSLLSSFRVAWIVWAVIIVSFCIIFMLVFFRQYRRLQRQLHVVGLGTGPSRVRLQKALLNLHLTTGIVGAICTFYSGLAIFFAACPELATTNTVALQAEALFSLYNFAIFGTVGGVLAVVRALQSPKVQGNVSATTVSRQGPITSQVMVSRILNVEVDDPRPEYTVTLKSSAIGTPEEDNEKKKATELEV